jgi:hypothetical protein
MTPLLPVVSGSTLVAICEVSDTLVSATLVPGPVVPGPVVPGPVVSGPVVLVSGSLVGVTLVEPSPLPVASAEPDETSNSGLFALQPAKLNVANTPRRAYE